MSICEKKQPIYMFNFRIRACLFPLHFSIFLSLSFLFNDTFGCSKITSTCAKSIKGTMDELINITLFLYDINRASTLRVDMMRLSYLE